ncbi:hypothetical protein C8A03DRAFT_12252, partial [Achaetomium macrosporum]
SAPLVTPIPISALRRNQGLITQELFASLNATLASKTDQAVTLIHHIQEHDYSVPGPPPRAPPSPVSFRAHHHHLARVDAALSGLSSLIFSLFLLICSEQLFRFFRNTRWDLNLVFQTSQVNSNPRCWNYVLLLHRRFGGGSPI